MTDEQLRELVARLREFAPFLLPTTGWTVEERALPNAAADAIKALMDERDDALHDHTAAMRASLQMKARAERAEAALRPFVEALHETFRSTEYVTESDDMCRVIVQLTDMRRARAALAQSEKEQSDE